MGKTKIAWATDVWNPVTGCTKVSPGCAHCYIERTPPFRIAGRRFHVAPDVRPLDDHETYACKMTTSVLWHPERLAVPPRWRKPRRIFVCSMGDLFHESVPDEFILKVFNVMACAPRHTFQVLTKRPERMLHFFGAERVERYVRAMKDVYRSSPDGEFVWPLPNVWLGVSVENQRWADHRIPILLETPAAMRFVSCEPLLGPVDLSLHLGAKAATAMAFFTSDAWHPMIQWVIVGGESGPRGRPLNHAWVRRIREQCRAAGVAYFGKQDAARHPGVPLPGDLGDREWPA